MLISSASRSLEVGGEKDMFETVGHFHKTFKIFESRAMFFKFSTKVNE